MNEKLLKPYNPQKTEDRIYKLWEESGLFNPDVCIEKGVTAKDVEHFSIVLPPPNVTGTLHMGHAAMLAIEDIVVRYNRMLGKHTLWLPGTDHAAIATQSRVEKDIQKNEDKNRYDLGREELLRRIETFAKASHDTIVGQVRKMGASVDWSREAFTLDEKRELAVRTAFKNMYDDGLIYRGNRIVNWDPRGQTTISDDEIVHEERDATLYTFKYSQDFPIAISTTRPETKVGDTAVAVHPDDARYKAYVGKEFKVDFVGVPLSIKIVGDESVDPAFGTGALGVTPAHSTIDWEIAERHKLPAVAVIDEKARMTVEHPDLKGKKVVEAREWIVGSLREQGLIEKEEKIRQSVATAERTGGVIEPLPKLQWFIDVNKKFTLKRSSIKGIADGAQVSLKELMRATVANGQIEIMPDHFAKIYFHWIDNLRDWCISRQIWYGHRIPVWYRSTDAHGKPNGIPSDSRGIDELYVGIEAPSPDMGDGWKQDEDTLDTWFSSGLWTFSTLGWPKDTPDLRAYHPTNLLETGYDILFFWVARMILMTGYHIGSIPFDKVYLHGLVRDAKGRKMSKSLGNIIDPLTMIGKYGADATRLSLIVGNTPGTDLKLDESKIKGYKNFANKLWNIARFTLENAQGMTFDKKPELASEQHKIMDELDAFIADISTDIDNYRLYMAAEKLYHYIWHTFADKLIEASKPTLHEGSAEEKYATAWMLTEILIRTTKALHPFMPFVTEELWNMIPAAPALSKQKEGLLIGEPWLR